MHNHTLTDSVRYSYVRVLSLLTLDMQKGRLPETYVFFLSKQHREVVLFKAFAKLRVEASRYYLGFLWWVFHPLLTMAIFYLVFHVLLQRGEPDYVAFLLIGVTTWHWFSNTISHSMNSIWGGGSLMSQVDIPKVVFPCVIIVLDTIKFSFVFLILLIFLIIYGHTPDVKYISLPLILLVQLLVITAGAFLVAAVVPFMPDLEYVFGVLLRLMLFLSGIFYSSERIPEKYKEYFYLNPMANLIESYRAVMMKHDWPDWTSLGLVANAAIIGIVATNLFIKRFDRLYPRICP